MSGARGPFPVGECPVERTLRVIGRRWVGQVLWHLLSGRKRHGELLEAIGTISARMLTDRLRELEAAGFVVREAFAEVPLRVEYELTERGYSLAVVFEAMCAWGLDDQRAVASAGTNLTRAAVREPAAHGRAASTCDTR